MRKAFAAVLFLFGAAQYAGYVESQDLGFKNLKVLKPADKGELMRTMATYNKELGIKCEYCHDPNDYAKEYNDKYTRARMMQTMVNEINTKFFNYKDAPKVSCVFCHDGNPRPRALREKK